MFWNIIEFILFNCQQYSMDFLLFLTFNLWSDLRPSFLRHILHVRLWRSLCQCQCQCALPVPLPGGDISIPANARVLGLEHCSAVR